jgi:hypothetical protein
MQCDCQTMDNTHVSEVVDQNLMMYIRLQNEEGDVWGVGRFEDVVEASKNEKVKITYTYPCSEMSPRTYLQNFPPDMRNESTAITGTTENNSLVGLQVVSRTYLRKVWLTQLFEEVTRPLAKVVVIMSSCVTLARVNLGSDYTQVRRTCTIYP